MDIRQAGMLAVAIPVALVVASAVTWAACRWWYGRQARCRRAAAAEEREGAAVLAAADGAGDAADRPAQDRARGAPASRCRGARPAAQRRRELEEAIARRREGRAGRLREDAVGAGARLRRHPDHGLRAAPLTPASSGSEIKNPAEAGLDRQTKSAVVRSGLAAGRKRPGRLRAQSSLRRRSGSALGAASPTRQPSAGGRLLGAPSWQALSWPPSWQAPSWRPSWQAPSWRPSWRRPSWRPSWRPAFLADAAFLAAFFATAFLTAFLATAPSSRGASWPAPSSPAAFFAAAFFAVDFLAAFFAVAITFLLDQVDIEPPAFDASSASGYSSPETAQEGRPSTMNRGAGCAALRRRCSAVLRILISHIAVAISSRRPHSQDSAPPVWYSMTRVSKKLRSFFRSIISLIHGNGFSSFGKSSSRPICVARRLAM